MFFLTVIRNLTFYCNGYLFNVVNCQKSRKKCDDKRPCQRCIDLNITETCKDSARKARRATKRGPYKHRVQQN